MRTTPASRAWGGARRAWSPCSVGSLGLRVQGGARPMPPPTPESIEREVEVSGVARGTELFDIRVREKKVQACRDRRGLTKCSQECDFYEHCTLVKEHATD